MAGYRRFISYMYEYTKGKKNKNTGFVKVESRDGVCRMQVNLQGVPQEEEFLNVYGFVRKDDWLLGIFLGQIPVQGTEINRRITTPSEQFGGANYSLDDLAGIWTQSSFGRKYITVFDDGAVDLEKFVTELPSDHAAAKPQQENAPQDTAGVEQPEEEAEAVSVNAEPDETTKAASQTAEAADEAVEAAAPAQTETAENQEIPVQKTKTGRIEAVAQAAAMESGCEIESEEAENIDQAPQTNSAEIAETADEAEQEQDQEPEMQADARDAGEDEDPELQAAEAGGHGEEVELQTHSQQAATCLREPKQSCPRQEQCQQQGMDHRWMSMAKRYPHFQPFGGDEIEDCIQILPRDIRLLNQNNIRLGNNSFVMHGYYNYRHLMLGKRKDGGYVLGIPGLYDHQEKNMADMFGFGEFKDTGRQNRSRKFGYWCRRVE